MHRVAGSRTLAVALAFAATAYVAAQVPAPAAAPTNPMAGNSKAIEQGKHLYRGRCAVCHGLDARGYRANDLTSSERTLTSTDSQLHRLISRGIPGTEMPASTMHDDEIWMVVAYIRTLADTSAGGEWPGDSANGERLFWSTAKGNCGLCHMVRDRGGRLGPNLTRIGAARSRASLVREIRRSSEYIPAGYETVKVVTRDGKRVTGARRNEDPFSVQLVTAGGELLSFMKRDLSEVNDDPTSLMPDYGPDRLTDAELDDVLRYLQTLRGQVAPTTPAEPIPAPAAHARGVSGEHLAAGLAEPTRWVNYSGDQGGRRHSPLTQVGPANVHQLSTEWAFQTGVLGKFEATPLVIDGILYLTGPNNAAWAIDARTGRQVWSYRRDLPERLNICCGAVNRGFAALGELLYMATLDAHLVALDRKTGAVVWDIVIDDYKRGYTATVAPLVVKDKIIVGIAGAEYGVRGFIDAYDAATGKRAWRFWTIPAPGEPGSETWPADADAWERGGGSTWVTGTYDPQLNLIFWGTGNPSPDLYGDGRMGDNLYTDAVVALDADTGTLRWHFQFTPHDTHDWDAVQVPVLADMMIGGVMRKLMLFANRNGFYYTLDRTNGTLVVAKPFVKTTWAHEINRKGRPVVLPGSEPTEKGTDVCPDITGGTNWNSPSFNPRTGLLYVIAREVCATYYAWEQEFTEGQYYFGGAGQRVGGRGYGALRAIDPLTAAVKWEFKYFTPSMAGTLSTESGLVFGGDMDGNLMAFDASSGKNLWHFQTGAPLYAAPITYMLDGKQFVLMPAGTTLFAFALPEAR